MCSRKWNYVVKDALIHKLYTVTRLLYNEINKVKKTSEYEPRRFGRTKQTDRNRYTGGRRPKKQLRPMKEAAAVPPRISAELFLQKHLKKRKKKKIATAANPKIKKLVLSEFKNMAIKTSNKATTSKAIENTMSFSIIPKCAKMSIKAFTKSKKAKRK
eukprot:513483_1